MKQSRIATNILQSKEDTEEMVNDTYMKTWNAIPPEKPGFLFAYLAKICRHRALGKRDWNHAEKRKAHIIELTSEPECCIPAQSDDIEIDEKGIERLLNRFLEKLPYESRLIFVRRYWYADSIQEIAVRYSFSESKIKTQLHRIRKKLHDHLKAGDCIDDEQRSRGKHEFDSGTVD